jgi:hypothetical protein
LPVSENPSLRVGQTVRVARWRRSGNGKQILGQEFQRSVMAPVRRRAFSHGLQADEGTLASRACGFARQAGKETFGRQSCGLPLSASRAGAPIGACRPPSAGWNRADRRVRSACATVAIFFRAGMWRATKQCDPVISIGVAGVRSQAVNARVGPRCPGPGGDARGEHASGA